MIYGTFEMMPAIFDDGGNEPIPYSKKEAWVCIAKEWRKLPWEEVYANGKVDNPRETEAEFWAYWKGHIPPLPPEAFARLRYGVFTSLPCIWNDDAGWVLYGADWRKHHIAEIMNTAKPRNWHEFKRSFPDLPPLPPEAFAGRI
jgi:hypothetical protein